MWQCLIFKFEAVRIEIGKWKYLTWCTSVELWLTCFWCPSRQILVPRLSWGRPPPALAWRRLKILFDRPGDFPIWRLGDVLIWFSRDFPGRSIWYVPRTLSGHLLEDLQSTQTWMSQLFFKISSQNLFDWPNLSKSISTNKVYWESSQTSKMEHFLKI